MKLVTEQLLKDIVLGIDLALEKIPDECDCQAYTESDTNATIHQEEVCQVFSRYHLEAVKSDIEKILSAAEHHAHTNEDKRAWHGVYPGHEEGCVCLLCEASAPQVLVFILQNKEFE